jgi:hypothetical protein
VDTLVPLSDEWRPLEAPATPVEKAERPALFALGAMLAIDLAIFGYVAVRGFVGQPYSDMFDFIRAEFGFERSRDLAAYVATAHNSQFLVWIRLLTTLDIRIFRGTGIIFAAAGGVALALAASAIGLQIWRSVPVRSVGAAAALLAVPLILSAIDTLGVTQPINVVYPLAAGFMILAVISFERAGTASGGRLAHLVLALSAAVLAMCGSAAGLAVWPALILSAVRNPANRRLLAPTLVLGLIAIAVVADGLLGAPTGHPASSGAGRVLRIAEYFMVYLGLPWSAVSGLSRIPLLIGLINLGVGGALVFKGSSREGAAGVLERIGLDLMLCALATAAMAAMGRVDQSAAIDVPVRYAVFMALFQVGLICILALWIADRWDAVKRHAPPLAMALGLALVGMQVFAAANCLRYSNYVRTEIAAFDAGVRRPEMRQLIHPDYDVALAVQAECRRRGIYQ